MNIIFGTKKLGQTVATKIAEKYPDLAVVTVEGQKGAKKSRRILFNSNASRLLNLESGSVQVLMFGSLEAGENNPAQVLVMNTDSTPDLDPENVVTYKTSKNLVSYSEDTSEKGKSVTSSYMCNEVFSFLGLEDSQNIEFELVSFDSEEVEAFAFVPIVSNENTIETNNSTMTAEEVIDSVQDQVAQAEENNPIFNEEPVASEENTGIPQRQNVEAPEWV